MRKSFPFKNSPDFGFTSTRASAAILIIPLSLIPATDNLSARANTTSYVISFRKFDPVDSENSEVQRQLLVAVSDFEHHHETSPSETESFPPNSTTQVSLRNRSKNNKNPVLGVLIAFFYIGPFLFFFPPGVVSVIVSVIAVIATESKLTSVETKNYLVICDTFLDFNVLVHKPHEINQSILEVISENEELEEDMDWLTKCSICFDNRLDFCLQGCRDQFCRQCFQQYVSTLVRSSWGLSVQPIKCPVCHDILQKYEWSRYVDRETIDLYNRYNQPYRALSRHCVDCHSEIKVAEIPVTDAKERESRCAQICDLYEQLLNINEEISPNFTQFAAAFRSNCDSYLNGNALISTGTLWSNVVSGIKKFLGMQEQCIFSMDLLDEESPRLNDIEKLSRLLISLEISPDLWRQMQFEHMQMFKKLTCQHCNVSVCFSCGEKYHGSLSCHDSIQQRIEANRPPPSYFDNAYPSPPANDHESDRLASLDWKLRNSKHCPNCSVLINRDDGCHKVDCVYCGHKICLGKFENGNCGFYKCQLSPASSFDDGDIVGSMDFEPDVPELGVPDVNLIQSRARH
ncbi:E3 ubiquitin-protein ligase arih2 [Nowakowskiella sp. JEL0407]|nr:E3 ubiquitin-protein ligase arih2 [Nowakowskiella sp. JEL0407]